MGENAIVLKSVENLLGENFFIPSYQRGYRWKEQQVKDLLNDIDEFIKQQKNDGFYCIQPLVVKESDSKWEVIDGQQRLTTIFILLSYLDKELKLEGDDAKKYILQYETRSNSADFLNNIANKKEENCTNIDFYHMYHAYKAIKSWFGTKTDDEKTKFKEILREKVKFIWYESTDEDPIKVFTRLNIGKISLTNAELIKALFLNRSNFSEGDASLRLKQQEIASEWDKIEYTLQNDEFWLFLNQSGYDKPTRIDMIFDLICEQDRLGIGEQNIGTDQYKTFRYFYQYFKNYPVPLKESDKSKIEFCWRKVKEVFQIFEEWYNDLELYHYVGYLVDQGEKIAKLVELWKDSGSKLNFVGKLKEEIKGKILNCKVLTQQYEVENKTNCKPLILLHNVQTVINQNKNSEDTYKLSAFYKFPFHLYKSENWDVEHIDSNTENNLDDLKSQKEWLKDISLDIPNDNEHKELADKIRNFIKNNLSDEKSKEQDNTFKDLCEKVEEYSPSKSTDRLQENNNDIDEKNMIWNYCLLDRSTNRSNGNAVFSVKRRAIIAKDQGKTFVINDDLSISSEDSVSAFVLPCTKNVFLKYYNSSTNVLRAWTREDAKEYLLNINDVLSKAGFISNQQTKIDTMYKGEKK